MLLGESPICAWPNYNVAHYHWRPFPSHTAEMGDLKVTGLFVYPVKSCRGISLSSAQLEKTGLAWDRRWCVVKQATGRFVTQREHPKLALVSCFPL